MNTLEEQSKKCGERREKIISSIRGRLLPGFGENENALLARSILAAFLSTRSWILGMGKDRGGEGSYLGPGVITRYVFHNGWCSCYSPC